MPAPRIRIEPDGDVARAALAELAAYLQEEPDGLVSFATGRTFARFFAALAPALECGEVGFARARATHLDEYLGFAPAQRGGMVHELLEACPPLRRLLAAGRFVAVPADGADAALRAHERRLAQLGGVGLQFLGVGRNGHVAFNEPGTPWDVGFHRAPLAETTRADARARFAPAEPPREAVTAGPRDVLAARRLVLVASGASKAQAVQSMLEGPIGPACPASLVRAHRRAIVLLDGEAAALLARGAH
jgi:glucosamine-6-phosphate deaminase